MHLDALKLADALRDRLTELALEEGHLRDGVLREQARALWSGPPELGGLVGELWVEGAFGAERSGQTLRDLEARGVIVAGLVEQLERSGAMPPGRHLYTHQQDALMAVHEARTKSQRPGLVVTAGTGAGKTESFLLPLLDELWRTPGRPGQGMSALLLYPMNALVVDQVKRLSSWLDGQQRLTFFHFTSETPEDHKRANEAGIEPRPLPYFRTRQQARGRETAEGTRLDGGGGRTPDVVVTNYSMLEYMLCRPQDGVFFGDNLRVVVLDEAHLYNGTLAAEIALLLRRLLERCGKQPEEVLFLAASATLGSGTEAQIQEQLRTFGASLSSKQEAAIQVIQGRPQPPSFHGAVQADQPGLLEALSSRWVDIDTLRLDTEGKVSLLEDPEHGGELRGLLRGAGLPGGSEDEACPAVLLHDALEGSGVLRHAAALLFERQRMPLRELAEHLWGAECPPEKRLLATVRLLTLGASARRSVQELPLLPHRLHAPVRGSEGLSVCLSPRCSGPYPIEGRGSLLGGHQEFCPFCEKVALPLLRCEDCGEPLLVSREPRKGEPGEPPEDDDYVRGWASLRLPNAPLFFRLRTLEPASALQVVVASGEILGEGESALLQRVPEEQTEARCPSCSEPLLTTKDPRDLRGEQAHRGGLVRPYQCGAPLTTLLLAETMLPALPPISSPLRASLPAEGRRLLAFSDSRRSAARLGPLLTDSHARRVFQSALVCFLDSVGFAESLVELVELQSVLEKQLSRNPGSLQLQKKVATGRAEIEAQKSGHPIKNLPALIAGESGSRARMVQLLHAECADVQEPPWSQQLWEENGKAILAEDQLLGLLGRELARRATNQRTLEGLGLVELVYPGLARLEVPASLGVLLTLKARQMLEGTWPTLVALLCDTLRADGCITLGSKELDDAYSFGEGWLGRWVSLEQSGWRCTAFRGQQHRQRRRAFASAALLRLGVSGEQADELSQRLLDAVFLQLSGGEFPWVEVDESRQIDTSQTVRALRVKFTELALRSPEGCWRSQTSGRVWPRAFPGHGGEVGLAPEPGCMDLVPVAARELDQDVRLGRARRELFGRNEGADGRIFHLGLWAEEHSAQRSPQTNRRVQGLFEQGARNVLSASTTLEVGIDVGGLNGVLMANAPPSKSNYLQRAGRAGRRTDGSSIAVPFCHPRPFDREVFLRFDRYIGRPLRRPRVIFERTRIALRHAHAWLLGDFFHQQYQKPTGAMLAFGRLGGFLGLELPAWWDRGPTRPAFPPGEPSSLAELFKAHLNLLATDPPARVIRALTFLLAGTPGAEQFVDIPTFFRAVREAFEQTIAPYLEDLHELRKAYELIPVQPGASELNWRRGAARALWRQMDTLASMTLIEALSDRQFLPKFGFPVGVQRLKVMVPDEDRPRRLREEDSIRLERSSLLALSEYVPGAQVLVGGKVVTSRGVLRHFVGNAADDTLGQRGHMITCEKGHITYRVASEPEACHACGRPGKRREHLLLPRHGFLSAGWDPPVRGLEASKVGFTEQVTVTFGPTSAGELRVDALGGIRGLEARYREDGEILVFNRGEFSLGFALCTACGYAESEWSSKGQGAVHLPRRFERHAPLTSSDPRARCWREDEAPVLRHHVLAAREITDVLLIQENLRGSTARSAAFAETLGRALQIAGARLLEVDTRELGVLALPSVTSHCVVLFDNIPGGVGHVRELLDLGRVWLEEACQVLFLDEEHDARCKKACLDCILTFDAQAAASRGLLDRQLVLSSLKSWLAGVPS
jgi:DEAD/DEAH box helicase domain-containing protein